MDKLCLETEICIEIQHERKWRRYNILACIDRILISDLRSTAHSQMKEYWMWMLKMYFILYRVNYEQNQHEIRPDQIWGKLHEESHIKSTSNWSMELTFWHQLSIIVQRGSDGTQTSDTRFAQRDK
jgi:hypothetical protein